MANNSPDSIWDDGCTCAPSPPGRELEPHDPNCPSLRDSSPNATPRDFGLPCLGECDGKLMREESRGSDWLACVRCGDTYSKRQCYEAAERARIIGIIEDQRTKCEKSLSQLIFDRSASTSLRSVLAARIRWCDDLLAAIQGPTCGINDCTGKHWPQDHNAAIQEDTNE